jgi:hypothetical protein
MAEQNHLMTVRAIAFGFALLTLAGPANAQRVPADYEQEMGHAKPVPGVPDDLRSIITSATPERLEIRSLSGQTIRLPIVDIEPSDFRLLGNGRFLGFKYVAVEAGGYWIVDRARADATTVYGGDAEPLFSPDSQRFALLSSPQELDNLLGSLTVHDLLPQSAVLRFSTNLLPLAAGWRIERWQGNQCLIASFIEAGWQPQNAENFEQESRTAPRVYVSVLLGARVFVHRSGPTGVCSEEAQVQE